jgi:hypothetical protein
MFIHTVNIISGAAKFVKLYFRKLCFLGGFTARPSFQDCSNNKHIHAVLRIRDPRWKKSRSRTRDEHPGFFDNFVSIFWVKNTKNFDADLDPGLFHLWI